MLSAQTIRDMSDYAAYRAAEEGHEPLAVWSDDDLPHLPFLGEYVPRGYRVATWADMRSRPRNETWGDDDNPAYTLVDASGFGSVNEPALTYPELADYVAENGQCYWAIVETGQFQVVVAAYIQDNSSEGVPAPEIDPCDYCGGIHGPLDECDPCPECGEYHDGAYANGCPEEEDSDDA